MRTNLSSDLLRQALVSVFLSGVIASSIACGGDDSGTVPDGNPDANLAELCSPTGAVNFNADAPPCDNLSSYGFFTGNMADQIPNDGVIPYEVNSALYSDYASKYRFVWMPDGAAMSYDAEDTFTAPVGAVFVKTFAYLADLREPDGDRRLLETRLLFHSSSGWDVVTYQWNDEQTEATRTSTAVTLPVSWIHTDGQTRSHDYRIPTLTECEDCHQETMGVMGPVGIKARHLNRDFAYPGGTENQLEHLAAAGYLDGLPGDLGQVPRAPVWDDPSTGSADERVRAWLDMNCANCHNPAGTEGNLGLDLSYDQTTPYDFGVCRPPSAQRSPGGNQRWIIEPGQSRRSILATRLETLDPELRMPVVGSTMVADEAAELVRQWIDALSGGCSTSAE